MTFTELNDVLGLTGRRSLASLLVFTLADALDNNLRGINLDDFEAQSGYFRTNIRAVASTLREHGVIDIYYYDVNSDDGACLLSPQSPRGRWSKHHYRLADSVKTLLKRSQ
ncbi:hypothetical protein [Type-D symbiont of Plautia stali]|uniref:hypothetical protein n=1 Tax=Type-D symbiont of Plautia stali TaxID=1560356 RepID=UPI00073E2F1F|nr:hypothetical protein [Type-D symbiont of Plautia stali]